MSPEDRTVACFQGLATGDAVGKQTETLSQAAVREWYPEGITGFHGVPGGVIPRYLGKRYEWRVGETTDDTEQTLAVARAILRAGQPRRQIVGEELLRCRKSLHPGVSLWNFMEAADPARVASDGDGCGAAMRASPVGIVYAPDRLDEIVRGAVECSLPTHGGHMAICAAAAVAAAVSAAVEGSSVGHVLETALEASKLAETLRPSGDPRSFGACLDALYDDLAAESNLRVDYIAGRHFPRRTETTVPLAIALAVLTSSAERTILLAANVGGDADSVASIGGAIAAAINPESVSDSWFEIVNSVNSDDIAATARSLASMRA